MAITYLEAIREAQAKLLADDPRVFIYGQDVGNFGGAFKATKGLAKEFPGRVLDSPISEDAQVGLAIGAAFHVNPIVQRLPSLIQPVEIVVRILRRIHYVAEAAHRGLYFGVA
jgi:pyruvate/2-oxoglutarate/acetoin dehydrogenase E1 component